MRSIAIKFVALMVGAVALAVGLGMLIVWSRTAYVPKYPPQEALENARAVHEAAENAESERARLKRVAEVNALKKP